MSFNNYTLCLIVLSDLVLNSCSVLEPAPPAASFIHIDSIPVSSNVSTQGSNSSRVTDAWVIYDNQFLGTFPLPADFPVLGEGSHRLQIRAGIIENGISSIRSAYPKYDVYDTTVSLVANQKTTVTPKVSYLDGAVFVQLEDFDDATLTLTSVNSNYADLLVTPPGDVNAFENNSGYVTLNTNRPTFEVATATPFTLPLDVPTYLELNYKCENDFEIGMYVTTATNVVQTPLLSVRASGEWKKIYVSLSDLGGVQAAGLEYKIYFHADLNSTMNEAKLYFDNLKVVY